MKKKLTRILGVALPLAMVLALAITLLPASTPTAEAALTSLKWSKVPIPKMGSDGDYVMTPDVDLGATVVTPGGSVIFAADDSSLSDDLINMSANLSAAATTITLDNAGAFRYSGVVSIDNELIFYGSTNNTYTGAFPAYAAVDATGLLECTRGYGGTTKAIHADDAPVTERTILYKSTDGGHTWGLTGLTKAAFGTAAATADNSTIVDVAVSPEYSSDGIVLVATQKKVYQSVDGGSTFSVLGTVASTQIITDLDVSLDSNGQVSVIFGTTTGSQTGEVYVYCPAILGLTWNAQTIVASDVLAVAFSPNFDSDLGIFAVTYDGTDTQIEAAFGNIKTGGGWGDNIGTGEFKYLGTDNMSASRARIAFPDDFDVDSITSNIAFVGLSAGPDNGALVAEMGDVYEVTFQPPPRSSTVDLNVRGIIGGVTRTATNIYSIDVSGDAEAATIIVGTNHWTTSATVGSYYWTAYYSTDSGVNWSSAREKSPTGGDPTWSAGGPAPLISGSNAATNVVMAPDFATSGVAYAATKGAETSGFSRTSDGGKSWNQISLMDYGRISPGFTVGAVKIVSPYPSSNTFDTVFYALLESKYWCVGTSVLRTTDGGGTYERLFSYANPTATSMVYYLEKVGSTMFLIDVVSGKFFRSSDNGATWPRTVTAKYAGVTKYSVVDETTIYTVYDGGEVWYSTNLGRPWLEPDESSITGTPSTIGVKGENVYVGTTTGPVYFSSDSGENFVRLGVTNPGSGYVSLTWDEAFADTHIIYANIAGAGGGVHRIEVNLDDPDSTEWEQIDAGAINIAAGSGTVEPELMYMIFGVLYVVDSASANVSTGGVWRSLNPRADTESLYPPEFIKENNGLDVDAVLGLRGISAYPNTVWCANGEYDYYYNQLVAFSDTVSSAVILMAPDDGATAGVRLSTVDLTQTVILSWEAVTGATHYQYQVATDEEFKSIYADAGTDFETGQQARVSLLIPGMTYYWRVRVEEPLLSLWSEIRSFTIAAVEPEVVVAPFDIITPERGASDVSIQPTFVWAEYEGAVSYELVVAEDPTFAIIDWSRTSANPFYKAEEALAYDTTYAWKVRAAPDGPWATGVFTTEAAPVEPVEPVVIEPAPPTEIKIVEVPAAAPIPTYLLWTIIGVGAVLFIALIVLIVRTRRVT